ncbi:MAG TPA: DoxX family protein [Solirubrobacteraceae bacterium]|jgi:putative oxidoreductase
MGIARLLLRLTIGTLFVGHGAQKLFGAFGGPGLSETASTFEKLGLRPGRHHALAAGAAEMGGGALLAAGYATPVAAATLTATMATAIDRVHAANGPWVTNGGYEYNLVLIAAVTALAESGPGALALGKGRHGSMWALGALGGGLVAAAATRYLAEASVSHSHDQPLHTALSAVQSGWERAAA